MPMKIKNKMKKMKKKKMKKKKIMILIIGIIYIQNQFEMPKFKYLKTEMKFQLRELLIKKE